MEVRRAELPSDLAERVHGRDRLSNAPPCLLYALDLSPAPRVGGRRPSQAERVESGLDRLVPELLVRDEQGLDADVAEGVEHLDVSALLSEKRDPSQRDEDAGRL